MPEPSDARADARPTSLRAAIDALRLLDDRADRIQALVDLAARYGDPLRRPSVGARRVPGCESEAYVSATPRADGTLDVHVAVRNPNGVAARALAVLLEEAASGAPPDEVRAIDDGVVEDVFGPELSVSKAVGLVGIVRAVRALAGESPPGAGAT